MELAAEEKALFVFEPTSRMVPTSSTRMTASITASSFHRRQGPLLAYRECCVHFSWSGRDPLRWSLRLALIQFPTEGNFLANLSGVVQQLKKARARAEGEVQRLGAALAALGNLSGRSPARKRLTMSAAARRKISLAQKARWAKRNSNTQKGCGETQAHNVSSRS